MKWILHNVGWKRLTLLVLSVLVLLGGSVSELVDRVQDDQGAPGAHIILRDADHYGATLIIAASDSKNKQAAHYVCDGVADNVEWQAMMTAGNGTCFSVFALPGTYNFAAQVDLVPNVEIVGGGYGAVITQPANTNIVYLFRGYSIHNVTFRNIRINGNRGQQSPPDQYTPRPMAITGGNVTLDGCWFEDAGKLDFNYLYTLTDGQNWVMRNCVTDDICTVTFHDLCIGVKVDSNILRNHRQAGIECQGGNVTISNNVITAWGRSSGQGIDVSWSKGVSITGNTLSQVGVTTKTSAIYTEDVTLNPADSISGNSISYTGTGIWCRALSGTGLTITGNSIANCSNGIRIEGATDSNISGNSVRNCTNQPIRATRRVSGVSDYLPQRLLIEGNVISGGLSTAWQAAVQFEYTGNSTVQNNLIYGSATANTYWYKELSGSGDNLVQLNTVKNMASYAPNGVASSTKIRNNTGYVTENWGTVSATAGQVQTIAHGLATTPTIVLCDGGPNSYCTRAQASTSTNIYIIGNTTATYSWEAKAR